jgi:hypothetical protein
MASQGASLIPAVPVDLRRIEALLDGDLPCGTAQGDQSHGRHVLRQQQEFPHPLHIIFFRIDADADLPIPKEAKQEYAKLKSSELQDGVA